MSNTGVVIVMWCIIGAFAVVGGIGAIGALVSMVKATPYRD